MFYYGFPERVPYSNFHDLNLDWLLREVKQTEEILAQAVKDIGAVSGSSLPDLNNQTKELRERAAVLEQRATALEQRANATDAEIAAIKADASAIHADITSINTQIANIVNNHNSLEGRVEYLEDHPYILPQMSSTVLGGAKADTKTADDTIPVHIDAVTGKLFVPAQSVSVPTATENTIGGVKAKNKTDETIEVKIDPNTGFLYVKEGAYTLPQAAENSLGGIKAAEKTGTYTKDVAIDPGSGILFSQYPGKASGAELGLVIADDKTEHDTIPVHIDTDGRLFVEPQSVYSLPIASKTNLGGIIAGPRVAADTVQIVIDPSNGALYAKSNDLNAEFLSKKGSTMAGSINMAGYTITGLTEPAQDSDAATKKYVQTSLPQMASDTSLGLVKVQGISSEPMPVEIAIDTTGKLKGSIMTAYNSPTEIGGVKKVIKTDQMTLPVGMDSDGKQFAELPFISSASGGDVTSWSGGSSTFYGYPFSADIAAPGVTPDDFPIVTWGVVPLATGNLAPVCRAGNGVITVFSKENFQAHWLSWIALRGRGASWTV